MQLVHGVREGPLLLSERDGDFDPVLDRLIAPALDRLAARLGSIPGLAPGEREAVRAGAAEVLLETVRRKATRVLVLEVNAARVAGRLTAADPRARWKQWLAGAAGPNFWESLAGDYPTLLTRLRAAIDNRCAAAAALARHFAADRSALRDLLPAGEPVLVGVEFGSGDSHRGGQTVAILRCAAGNVVYKPRSVRVDAVLADLLARLLPDEPPATRIRVPRVLCRDGYGWAEFVEHRYCESDDELRAFYRNTGHWLAVMRLLGGSDLHAENVIAAGPVPVVVDCETLFTPHPPADPSGYGLAVDRAAHLVGGSVLRTGLLPGRGLALGWRGVDVSAAGALPGQQPAAPQPVLVDAGTDRVHIGLERAPLQPSANHPSPDPVLRDHWHLVLDAFEEMTGRLRAADCAGDLAGSLERFADCPVRLVLRDTEIYAELGRMLWHPVSLHDEPAARARAADLLARQAKNMPEAPGDPAVIEAEIDDLLVGDVPFFATTPRAGWGAVPDLVDDALRRWRETDSELDGQVIRAALVSAYLNEGWQWDGDRVVPSRPAADDLDRRRRALAAGVVRSLIDAAIRGADGTVTWIAPVLTPAGWVVQPLTPDGYGGLAGLAVLLAGYGGEVSAGRADPVGGVPGLLDDVLRTMRAAEDQAAIERREVRSRPESPGGYVGLGSRIWGWLLLHRLGIVPDAIPRARALAEQLPEAVRVDAVYDVLSGMSGAIVPLLRLSEHDGDSRWPALAARIAERLGEVARRADGRASWPNDMFPAGVGGFAHGATGIGWALSFCDARPLAEAAFAYEESLYAPELGGWRDLREPDADWAAATWCHGAGGIGIAAADLLRRTGEPRWADVLRRAAAGCWASGMGWNHTLCHGDLGSWEVLRLAMDADLGPSDVDRAMVDAHILSSMEEHGPVAGLARDAFSPGLMPGIGGMAYQLLRMHPDCPLPSVLLPDPHA